MPHFQPTKVYFYFTKRNNAKRHKLFENLIKLYICVTDKYSIQVRFYILNAKRRMCEARAVYRLIYCQYANSADLGLVAVCDAMFAKHLNSN